MSVEAIIFYILLIDSVVANLFVLLDGGWYTKHFRLMSRFFPLTLGWTLYYFVLVVWVGSLLNRAALL